MTPSATETTTPSSTVVRVTMLLRVLAEAEKDCSLGEIAEQMGLPASTTHRLLNLLLEQQFVERGDTNRTYRAGLEFLRLGGLISSRAGATQLAQVFMRAVVDGCGETCMLSLYAESTRSCMITGVIYGSHPLRYEAQLFHPSSLAWGATGRGILAFLPEATIDEVLSKEEASPAHGKKASKTTIKRELGVIASRGFALTRGQKVAGALGISSPVFNAKGVVAALCVTLPESRLNDTLQARIIKIVSEQARKFSTALGHRPG